MSDLFACPKRTKGAPPIDQWVDDPRYAGDPASAPVVCSFCWSRKPSQVIALVGQGRKLVGKGDVRNFEGLLIGGRVLMQHFSQSDMKALGAK